MEESKRIVPMELTDEFYSECGHVCLIYDNEEQRKKIVSEYMTAGLRKGEAVRYFTDRTKPEEIRSWLLEIGVVLPDDEGKGSFSISKAEDYYLPDGVFDPRALINGAPQRFAVARKAGYSGTRACGEMTWALRCLSDSDRLMEYEALLNTVTDTFPHSGMCQYDARIFDGATLFKVLRVHPYMIAQGQIVSNPFYMRPEEFMAELNAVKQARDSYG